mmetsp:Transcript_3807/g.7298  ORF Transcript_3807/g.7298 Transcript_3807/m.7298 type:complete len:114 (-) Transcript_3807:2208-2549(-)
MTFSNHGCDGSFNVLDWTTYDAWRNNEEWAIVTEQNATEEFYDPALRYEVYDIYTDRHISHSAVEYMVASRDIKAGEEILSNHVFYRWNELRWIGYVDDLKRICRVEDVGFIA